MKKKTNVIKLTIASVAIALLLVTSFGRSTTILGIDPPTPPGSSVLK